MSTRASESSAQRRPPPRRSGERKPGRTLLRAGGAAVLAVLLLAAPVAAPASAAPGAPDGNPVVTWDLHAERAVWDVARQPPYVTGRSFAVVHGAVYDAVNAIAGTPYAPLISAPRATGRESVPAAVATAAYRTLDWMFPAQHADLTATYQAYLDEIPDGRAERDGIAVGSRAADAMIANRTGDGAYGDRTWTQGTAPGQWRPTPPTFAQDGAWVGYTRPFVLPSADLFRTAGPPALTSRAYARELNEVKDLGGIDSTKRTADQTEAAIWWHDRRLTIWEIRRQLATAQRLGTLPTARLFALVNTSIADSAVICFAEKDRWSFWRPVTAVRLADTDGNPATHGDPDWTPLAITPPHPDFTSGHACSTGSVTSAFRAFFGRDDIPFSAYSADAGTRRHYTSFSQARDELIGARVWAGVHFRSADVHGTRIGEQTTAYLLKHAFYRT
ncbi:vanadium-dependent haloperoxidase [Catenuloplanes atrovinosus]|uniref:PAP2 superfamily protein n=1 Tax=Catenuloplanes atrovinosus TaxID=137266 RepID=A0AAE3YJX6_9ACTN|nr:vanadium-dependent haloperoxidase [Catenuloplanes atrovinosus]MDR7275134.1 hypothetical protein [Catenuloplanes atrovinosus]